MAAPVGLIGDKELTAKLKRLSAEARGDLLMEAALEGAKPIVDAASANAPRRTGRLASEIVAVEGPKHGARAEAHIGPEKDAYWGLFNELGTVNMAAQPFLRPALDEKKDEATRRIGQALWKTIKRKV